MSPAWALLLCAAAACPDGRVAVPQPEVVARLAPIVHTGTLLFSQGDCLAVKVFSVSRYTHVGIIVAAADGPVVYDSMNGTGVRKTELADYVAQQTPCELLVVHPTRPLTTAETQRLSKELEQHLGRPYGIRHHLTGETAEGMHCAEYATQGLIAAGLLTARHPARVSPGSLLVGALESGAFTQGSEFALQVTPVPEPAQETWCQWSWRCTTSGVLGSCVQLRRWFLCR